MTQTSKDLVERTLNFENPDRVPRDLWFLPAVEMNQQDEKKQLLKRYPPDIQIPKYEFGTSAIQKESDLPNCYNTIMDKPKQGEKYIDEWGSVFYVAEDGVLGEVKEPAISDWDELESFEPPWDYLESMDLSKVDKSCKESDKFILSGLCAHPFERLQYLRGSENLYKDLIRNRGEIEKLLEMIHEFNLTRIEMWLNTDVDAISMMDDWGDRKSVV